MVFHTCLDQNSKNMKQLIFLCLLFDMSSSYKTGSHSLWMMATYIEGKTPFPEFTVCMMLDDIVYAYYDSNEHKVIHRVIRQASDRIMDTEDKNFVNNFVGYVHGGMKDRASIMKNFFNHTNGIHVFQRAAGCELLDNNKPGVMISKDAYNGENVEEQYYDVDHNSLHSDWRWPNMDSKALSSAGTWQYQIIYHPNCIKFLKKHLAKIQNRVLKKVKPRVRLLQKTLTDSGGAKVTCLATGFYPRHINLTLLRDGQPVSDHQITGGELLPNGDETYQMRKSLEVSTEELQKHLFTCTAEHLSLDNKININIDSKPELNDVTSVITVIVVVIGACLIVLAAAIYLMWQRKGSRTSPQSSYTSASSEDERGMPLEPVTS
ncbi:major histocompatibility complex class I-related gene protein-like isoform X2 [Clupea harengus]|uniref:Major histocompatibility complex class I-related gene protein-like isoform X2 n=1 Tax=Clupea harengus TaxID=7950 RepID=A0A6P8FBU7_CLUHA|nr:major histocompatibility complex class I-related gene protein-like isoform X2 [Clupea harengus]